MIKRIFSKPLGFALFSFVFLFKSLTIQGEGTKQLQPNSSVQSAYLQIWDQNDPTRKFMTFDDDTLYRLNIKICNLGEKIHIGFQQPDTNVFWKLIAPNGSVVI